MTIPLKYEDVVAKLDAALAREAALREELERTKKAYEAYGIDFDRSEEKVVALQQRLTDAEQLLRDIVHSGEWSSSELEFIDCDGFEILEKIDASLKPDTKGECT